MLVEQNVFLNTDKKAVCCAKESGLTVRSSLVFPGHWLKTQCHLKARFVEPEWLSAELVDRFAEDATDWISPLSHCPPAAVTIAGMSLDKDGISSIVLFLGEYKYIKDCVAQIQQVVTIKGQNYILITGCTHFENTGRVRLVRAISDHDFHTLDINLMCNRLDWSPQVILSLYLSGDWPI